MPVIGRPQTNTFTITGYDNVNNTNKQAKNIREKLNDNPSIMHDIFVNMC